MNYTTGLAKGDTPEHTFINGPKMLGNPDSAFTSEATAETFTTGQTALGWVPCAKGKILREGAKPELEASWFDVKAVHVDSSTTPATTTKYYANFQTAAGVTAGTISDLTWFDATGTAITSGYTIVNGDKVYYAYDNVIIPQAEAKIPTIVGKMEHMTLYAKARRIAINYSQIAAFEAKNDYGFDLADSLAEQAVGKLSYDIDTEIVELIRDTAATHTTNDELAELTWSKTLPVGVNKFDHYNGFMEIVGIADKILYQRTQRFSANYMIIDAAIKPVLLLMEGFKAAPAGQVNGPYYCGTLGSLKVYVSPTFTNGEFVVGVNGSDLMSSVAVYAPLTNYALAA